MSGAGIRDGFRNPLLTGAEIPDGIITSAKLDDGAVTTAKLADLAVEAAKLANSSVTATKIANLAVGTAAIANGAITTAKIGDAQITSAKIDDLTALLFRTASSGERLVIDGDTGEAFIRMYDSSNTLAGLVGYEPSGYGSNTMVLSNELNLGDIDISAGGTIELIADGSAGFGVWIKSDANGAIPGKVLRISDSSGSPVYMDVYNSRGVEIFGQNPYTSGQAWLTLHSSSSGGSYDDQAAGISIGESGYLGSATGHIVYTGDGYMHIGMGTVTLGNNPPMAYPVFKLHYAGNRMDHVSDVTATGWARYSNSAPGSVRLETTGSTYRVYQHTSAAKFKREMRPIPIGKARRFVRALDPITYRSRETQARYAGLTADNVYRAAKTAKLAAELVAMGEDGKPESYGDEGIGALMMTLLKDIDRLVESLDSRVSKLERKAA